MSTKKGKESVNATLNVQNDQKRKSLSKKNH